MDFIKNEDLIELTYQFKSICSFLKRAYIIHDTVLNFSYIYTKEHRPSARKIVIFLRQLLDKSEVNDFRVRVLTPTILSVLNACHQEVLQTPLELQGQEHVRVNEKPRKLKDLKLRLYKKFKKGLEHVETTFRMYHLHVTLINFMQRIWETDYNLCSYWGKKYLKGETTFFFQGKGNWMQIHMFTKTKLMTVYYQLNYLQTQQVFNCSTREYVQLFCKYPSLRPRLIEFCHLFSEDTSLYDSQNFLIINVLGGFWYGRKKKAGDAQELKYSLYGRDFILHLWSTQAVYFFVLNHLLPNMCWTFRGKQNQTLPWVLIEYIAKYFFRCCLPLLFRNLHASNICLAGHFYQVYPRFS